MKQLRDLAAVLTAAALLLGALGTFAKQVAEIRKDQANTYQNTALQVGGEAEELENLKERVAELEQRNKP